MRVIELRYGSKKVCGIVGDRLTTTLRVDCDMFPDAVIEIPVTVAQVEALERRMSTRSARITEILPDIPEPIREIFISGTTPAEWDQFFREKLQDKKVYAALGYKFEVEG